MDQKLLNNINYDKFVETTDTIKKNYNISEQEAEEYLISLGPKKLTKLGVLDNSFSWRDGYTKKSVDKRVKERRKKNKMAQKSKKQQR